MKPAVLCITRQALPVHIPQFNAYGIYDVDLKCGYRDWETDRKSVV